MRENAIVRGWSPSRVVLRRQAINRDHNLQATEIAPREWDGANRARHQLCMNVAGRQFGQDRVELTVSNERLSAHYRHVKRFVLIDELHEPLDD